MEKCMVINSFVMINSKIHITILIILVLFYSCKKEAGYTGKAMVHVHVINGAVSVGNAQVKVKFNANSFPGASAPYEDTKLTDYTGKVDFENLSRGEYYFYSYFADTSGAVYEGGSYLRINNKPGETHIVIDFSEADPF